LYGVSFTDANTGTAVGSTGTILRTTDGGSTWNPQTGGGTTNFRGVAFTDANTGTTVGFPGVILRTTNGGAAWNPQTSGVTGSLMSVDFVDANIGTAVGQGGNIVRTTNGGTTWTTQPTGLTTLFTGVSFVDANNGTIVGYSGTIRRTTNGGETWVAQNSKTVNHLSTVFCSDVNNGTVGGAAGILLHTTTGGVVTGIHDRPLQELPHRFSLEQNYPNPFNPTTVIRYSLLVTGHVTVRVYDVLGREVALLVDEVQTAGTHTVRWNAGSQSGGVSARGARQPSVGLGYASGVYFYRLQAGPLSETRKLVLVR
jgi:hypothetical protein